MRTFVRNDQFEANLSFFSEVGSIERTKKTDPADRVVTGSRRLKVIVDEQDLARGIRRRRPRVARLRLR